MQLHMDRARDIQVGIENVRQSLIDCILSNVRQSLIDCILSNETF